MIKTQVTVHKISKMISDYKLNDAETAKLVNLKNSLIALSNQEINTKTKLIMNNNRSLIISMIRDALTDYDFVLGHELYSILKTIGKL
jgi:hypothetical protein